MRGVKGAEPAMRTIRDRSERGSGVAIRDMRADARALAAEEFEDRYGSAFLLLTAADLTLPRGPGSTEVRLADEGARRGDSTAALSLVAYPLRGAASGPGHMIAIGRSSECDVVIPDVSVSRFHAFARDGGDGRWRMLDAGSTNGTTVNGANVPQKGVGGAVALKAGDDVRLGQVELTFVDAAALLAFIEKLER